VAVQFISILERSAKIESQKLGRIRTPWAPMEDMGASGPREVGLSTLYHSPQGRTTGLGQRDGQREVEAVGTGQSETPTGPDWSTCR
jgi:hypothetical protein